jgi:hypothetical protein
MSGNTKRFIMTCVLVALPAALGATQHDVQAAKSDEEPSLSLKKNGDLTWTPSVRGISKYTFNLPQYGVAEAIRFEDTASLFYLSDIKEREFTVIEDLGPFIDITLSPQSNSIELRWPVSRRAFSGIKVTDRDGLNAYVTGNVITSTTAHSIHQLGVELGEEIEIEVTGTKLNLGESSEQFYQVTASSLDDQRYSVSYGQRYWQAVGDLDAAWVIGSDADDLFAVFQLEKNFGSTSAFLRLSTEYNSPPKFEIGLQINFDGGVLGDWRIVASNSANRNDAINEQSLGKHRYLALAPKWTDTITPRSLSNVSD